MFNARVLPAAIALWATLCGFAPAQSTYVKVADEFGTIQPGGPRPASNGNRFWNIQGMDGGTNASSGTLRFYLADLVTKLDQDFPGGWQIDNVTLVVEHDDSGFSLAGPADIFHFTDDSVAITNGADGGMGADAAPGNFSSLGVSPLIFDDTAVGKVSGASLGTLTLINSYNFTAQGDDNLDVFGTPDAIVDPAGAINITPDYTLSFPTANDPDEALATFTTELAADMGDWSAGGLETIVGDIEDGTDALSFVFAAGAATTGATYKGNPFGSLFPPRIYIQASASGPGPGLPGDYNENGTVDAADYVVWKENENTNNTLPNNTLPGPIGQDHYNQWRANFGETLGGGLGRAAVPEPASVALLLIGLAGWVLRRPVSRG